MASQRGTVNREVLFSAIHDSSSFPPHFFSQLRNLLNPAVPLSGLIRKFLINVLCRVGGGWEVFEKSARACRSGLLHLPALGQVDPKYIWIVSFGQRGFYDRYRSPNPLKPFGIGFSFIQFLVLCEYQVFGTRYRIVSSAVCTHQYSSITGYLVVLMICNLVWILISGCSPFEIS
jgi:hypothetical protein